MQARKIITVSFFILFLITGCGGKKKVVLESEKPAEKPKVVNQLKLQKRWNVDLGSAFSTDSDGFQITQQANTIFAASQSGQVKAINTNGKVLWTTKAAKKLSAGVGVGNSSVYVASAEGEVVSLDKETGKQQWLKPLSSEILTAPEEHSGTVISRSLDGIIYGLSEKTGDEKWSLSRNLPSLSLRRDTPPLIIGNVALFGLPSGQVIAINIANGRTVWDIPVSIPEGNNALERMRDIASKPIFYKNQLFVNSFQGDLISIDLQNRRLRWRKPVSSYTQLDIDSDNIYLTDSNSTIIAISQANGSTLWQNEKLLRRGVSAPKVVGNYLVVFGNDGDIYLLDKLNGELIGRYDFSGDRVIGTPIVHQNTDKLVFSVVSDNGNLYSYEITK